MNKIRRILLYSITLITILVGLILYQIKTYIAPTYLICSPDPVFFCGTSNPELTENQYKGKEIFNSNCAACHKLDVKNTGPALRSTDSLVFVKWMIDKNYKINSTKIEKLGVDYHRTMFKDFVNEENLPLLIDYCSRTSY